MIISKEVNETTIIALYESSNIVKSKLIKSTNDLIITGSF